MMKQRDPIQGQFFDTESIKNAADALVREAIQNSLDAIDPAAPPGPVRVHLLVSEDERALSAEAAAPYFEGMWNHLAAIPSSSGENLAMAAERSLELEKLRAGPCRFLVFEDFNTTGLQGDPNTDHEPEGEPNHFFYFWRAEGKSGKGGADRGRWGVGKYVFPAASRISTIFGFTIRSGEADPLLMGQAVLRNHQMDGKNYSPDAWWSDLNPAGLPVPVAPGPSIADFVGTWGLKRLPEQPGLSIVVPYIHDDVTTAELLRSVVRDYFAAIIAGTLIVEISNGTPGGAMRVDAETVADLSQMLEDETERHDVLAGIQLMRWGTSADESSTISLTLPEHDANGNLWTPQWSPLLLDEDKCALAADRLDVGEPVRFRVPVRVGSSRKSSVASHFDVLITPENGNTSGPLFVREGIVISEARTRAPSGLSLRDYRCIVLIEDAPLARMLGDAEGPAHTSWSERTPRFKNRYWLGKGWLDFIRVAPWRLLQLVQSGQEEEDRSIAADIFFIDVPSVEATRTKPRPGERGDAEGPPPAGSAEFRISPVSAGFSIALNSDRRSTPEAVHIQVAYDVARGNPFDRWEEADFELESEDITLELKGASVIRSQPPDVAANELVLAINDPDGFLMRARGFDERRDLVVRVAPASTEDEVAA